jgi:diguanylate cyclase (GGDEF)-like protein
MRLTKNNAGAVAAPRWSSRWAAASAIAALALVFALDRATDSAPVQHLYYLPIILAGVRFRMRGGILAGVSAIVLYHVANPHLFTFRYEESDVLQMVVLLAVGIVAARLADDADRLRRLSLTDDLTGLHNLRSFESRLASMVSAARAKGVPIGLLVLDVDRLKSLNDTHGHLTGAEAVRTVGRIVGQQVPPGAVACRYGGDEFVIALPDGAEELVQQVAEDLRCAVQATAPVLAGHPFAAGTLTISVGGSCASFDRIGRLRLVSQHDVEAGESLFRAADAALYRAKKRGRNQVSLTHGFDDGQLVMAAHHG